MSDDVDLRVVVSRIGCLATAANGLRWSDAIERLNEIRRLSSIVDDGIDRVAWEKENGALLDGGG